MAINIVPPRAPAQHEAGAHNALILALAYLNRGDLAAAQRKAAQALASVQQMQGVAHG